MDFVGIESVFISEGCCFTPVGKNGYRGNMDWKLKWSIRNLVSVKDAQAIGAAREHTVMFINEAAISVKVVRD